MHNERYILQNKIPVPEPDLIAWARWLETKERIVQREDVGHFWVSTVFLGLDHNFDENGPPLLFETMVFDHSPGASCGHDLWMDRTSTWELALEMHARGVAWAKDQLT